MPQPLYTGYSNPKPAPMSPQEKMASMMQAMQGMQMPQVGGDWMQALMQMLKMKQMQGQGFPGVNGAMPAQGPALSPYMNPMSGVRG